MLTFHADSFTSAGQPAHSSGPFPLRRSRLLHLGISGFLALLLSACSGSSDPAIVGESPTSQPRGTLLVEPASFTLSEGGTISLRAKLGSQAIGASQLTWSVSPSTVATIDAQGTLTAIRHGEATITARYSSLQATAHGSIWPIARSVEALTSTSVTGIVGQSLADGLRVRAIGSGGVPVPGVEVTFEVLSGNGTLSHSLRTTETDGVARVEWTMGTVPGQQSVRARAAQLGEFIFGAEVVPDYASATVEIVAGDDQEAQVVTFIRDPLQARVIDRFGNVLAGLGVQWEFLDGGGSNGASGSPGNTAPVVSATTDAQGMTAVFWKLGSKAGIQEVLCSPSTGTGANGSSGAAAVGGPSAAPPGHAVAKGFRARASAAEPDGVEVVPEESSTKVEATQQLSASLVDQYGNTLSGGSFVWTTDASGVVAVDNTGLAYGLKVGKGEVFAEDSSSKLKGSAWVSVEARSASAVHKNSGDGQKGAVGTRLANPVAVHVVDQVGSPVGGVAVAWKVVGESGSSAGAPGSAVTTTNSDGIASTTWTLGTKTGEQTLQASVDNLSSLNFTAQATPGPVTVMEVTPSRVDLEIGDSQQFSAIAKDEFGNSVTGASVTWSSSNADVATVSDEGLASAVAAGSVEIRAASEGVVGTAQVSVQAEDAGPQVASVTISPAEVNLEALEEKAQLAAVAKDPFGNPILDRTIAWQSLNSSNATVDSMGVVTAKTVGLALIVASASCCDVADTVAVQVTQVPAEVIVSPSSYTLAVGESYQLSGVVKDAMGYVIPGLEVTWASEDPSIAAVDESGTVKGFRGGATKVAGAFGSVSSLAQVTVTESATPREFTGYTIELAVTRLAEGTGQVLVSSGIPLTPGLLRPGEVDQVAVVVGGVEQSVYVEALTGRHPDESLRSILVQFHSNVGSVPLEGQLIIGPDVSRSTAGIARTEVSWDLPAAVALPTSAEYLEGTRIVGPTITVADVPGSPSFFQQYEENFQKFGESHWISEPPDNIDGNYYDRALIWYAWWVRTGDVEYWRRGTLQAYHWLVDWLRPRQRPYWTQPHYQLAEGIELRYLLVGDPEAFLAVVENAHNNDYFYKGYLGPGKGEGRMHARYLMSHILAHRLGDTSKNWAVMAEWALGKMLDAQNPETGAYDTFEVWNYEHVPYMTGMVHESFTEYYHWIGPDSRIMPAMKAALDFEWNNMWVPESLAFKYRESSTSGAPDMNGLLIVGNGWYYLMSRDPVHLSRSEAILEGLVKGAWLTGYKQFNQAYRSSYRYFHYRR